MKNSSVTVQIIEPDDDMWLTQAEDVEILARLFSKKVYLAVNDSKDNWKEITQAEYEQYQAQFEAARFAEEEAMAAMEQQSMEVPPEPEGPVIEEEQD
jgi:hypothetical protein